VLGGRLGVSDPDAIPHVMISIQKTPQFIPQTKPTSPDQTDATGRSTQRFSDQSDVSGPVRPIAPTS
jgi:hypothetical protein